VEVPAFDAFLYERLMWFGPFFMFARELHDVVGPFDEQFQVAGDLDWCARVVRATDRVEKGQGVGGVFADHGAGLSTSLPRRVAREAVWIRLRYEQRDFLPLWPTRQSRGFQCARARDSRTSGGWWTIPPSLREPIMPTPYSIDSCRRRGRRAYQLWTRLKWFLFPRYDLRRLRARLLSAAARVRGRGPR